MYNEFIEVDNENQRWVISQTRETFGWDEASLQRIIFSSCQEVNFNLLETGNLRWMTPAYVWLSINALYSEWLTPETPIIITWDNWMTLPYRFIGIRYRDEFENWAERFYEISVHDGELSLMPVYDLVTLLEDNLEFDNFWTWDSMDALISGAERPLTEVVGFFDAADLQWESISVSVPSTWTLAWCLLRGIDGIEGPTIECARKVEDELLSKFSSYIVTHNYPWPNEEITIVLTDPTAQHVHYLLATMPALEWLQPRHSGHPLHACPVFFIRVEFTDGTKIIIYVSSANGSFIKPTGTYTNHGDPGIIIAGDVELLYLLLGLFSG